MNVKDGMFVGLSASTTNNPFMGLLIYFLTPSHFIL